MHRSLIPSLIAPGLKRESPTPCPAAPSQDIGDQACPKLKAGRFRYALCAAALALSFVGTVQHSPAQSTEDHPIACAFLVEDGRLGHMLKGVVTAREDVRGRFEMRFEKSGWNSATVRQSGSFDLNAGESATLGQATLGRSGDVDAELTLSIDGTHLVCRSAGVLDL